MPSTSPRAPSSGAISPKTVTCGFEPVAADRPRCTSGSIAAANKPASGTPVGENRLQRHRRTDGRITAGAGQRGDIHAAPLELRVERLPVPRAHDRHDRIAGLQRAVDEPCDRVDEMFIGRIRKQIVPVARCAPPLRQHARRWHEPSAFGHVAHGLSQVAVHLGFRHEPGRAARHAGEHEIVAREVRQEHDPRRRAGGLDAGGCLETVEAGHGDVEDHDVGFELGGGRNCRRAVAHGRDNVARWGKETGCRLAELLMIVRDDDAKLPGSFHRANSSVTAARTLVMRLRWLQDCRRCLGRVVIEYRLANVSYPPRLSLMPFLQIDGGMARTS